MRKILLLAATVAAIVIPALPAHADSDLDVHAQVCTIDGHVVTLTFHEVVGVLKMKAIGNQTLDLEATCSNKGDAGEQGPPGDTGEKGDTGDKGDTGAPGTNGTSTNGVDGLNGSNGTDGAVGAAGKDADASELANLRLVVTELNNRLFLLEHAVAPDSPPATTTTVPQTATVGELPHTGSSTNLLIGIASGLLFFGLTTRFLARRNG